MLNSILQGLFEWLYGLYLDMIAYCANSLLGLMSTDMTFFEESIPAVSTMWSVFLGVGWALLIGNLVFQAMKAMFSGLGFEADNPTILFARTFIFSFLLIVSRQICELGLSITGRVIEFVGIPSEVKITSPDESFFEGGFSWVLVIIIGVILGFQLFKLFLELGERYVILCILSLLSPIGFAMGGSKSTKDIFTGYIRMFVSMLLMMVMNVVFLKLILSALSNMPSGLYVFPWCVLIIGLTKTARKIDNVISRIGLNPAATGDGGRSGMVSFMIARQAVNSIMDMAGSKSNTTNKSRSSSSTSTRNSTHTRKSAGTVHNTSSKFSEASSSKGSNISNSTSNSKGTSNSSLNTKFDNNSVSSSSVSSQPSSTHLSSSQSRQGGTQINSGSSNRTSYSRFGSAGYVKPNGPATTAQNGGKQVQSNNVRSQHSNGPTSGAAAKSNRAVQNNKPVAAADTNKKSPFLKQLQANNISVSKVNGIDNKKSERFGSMQSQGFKNGDTKNNISNMKPPKKVNIDIFADDADSGETLNKNDTAPPGGGSDG